MGLLDKVLGGKKISEIDEVDQSKEDETLCQWIRNKVEETRQTANRQAHEGIWMQNIAYVLGFDGLFYNTMTRSYQPMNKAAASIKRNRMHVNKILPTLQNRLAKLCKNPPKYDVRPNSNEQDDKDNAELKLNILEAKWDELGINEKRIPLYMWVQECGHAYLFAHWDSTLGEVMIDPTTEEFIDFQGDVRVDVVSPFEIFSDPLGKTFEECQWHIRAKVRPMGYFHDQFGEVGKKVKPEPTWLLSAQYDQRIQAINVRGASNSDSVIQSENTAIELTYYEKRSRKYPKGRIVIVASGVKLVDKELPIGKIPGAKFDDIPIGGKYFSEAIVTHLRPIQDSFNELVRRRTDWFSKFLAGKMIAARGVNLAQEAMSDRSGEIVEYDPIPSAPDGGKPQALQMPAIPQYAYAEEDKLDEQFNEVSGISEISKGNVPASGMPAIGMQLLVEMDDTRIGIMTEQHEMAYARIGQFILDYVQKFYAFERKIKFASDSGYNVQTLKGDDLRGDNDVVVIRGSTLPGSKVLKRQEIITSYQMGLLGPIGDPETIEQLVGMLEYGDIGQTYVDHSLDKNKVKRTLAEIEQGVMPDISEFDNHAFTLKELNRYRKSEKFDNLPPPSKDIFLAVMEESIKQMMMQSGMQPPPPPSPEEHANIQAAAGQKANDEHAQTTLSNELMRRTAETDPQLLNQGGL